MKLALLFFEIFEFEVEGSKSYKCQIKRMKNTLIIKSPKQMDAKLNGTPVFYDKSLIG